MWTTRAFLPPDWAVCVCALVIVLVASLCFWHSFSLILYPRPTFLQVQEVLCQERVWQRRQEGIVLCPLSCFFLRLSPSGFRMCVICCHSKGTCCVCVMLTSTTSAVSFPICLESSPLFFSASVCIFLVLWVSIDDGYVCRHRGCGCGCVSCCTQCVCQGHVLCICDAHLNYLLCFKSAFETVWNRYYGYLLFSFCLAFSRFCEFRSMMGLFAAFVCVFECLCLGIHFCLSSLSIFQQKWETIGTLALSLCIGTLEQTLRLLWLFLSLFLLCECVSASLPINHMCSHTLLSLSLFVLLQVSDLKTEMEKN